MNWGQWHKWHRTFGIIALVFVILLSITGIMLNHTHQLGLQEYHVRNDILLDWYDIRLKQPPIAFHAGNAWIVQMGDRVYFDGKELDGQNFSLVGAVVSDDTYVVAFNDRLLLISDDGELIEKISNVEGVPTAMKHIGLTENGKLVINAVNGNYLVNLDTLEWQKYLRPIDRWSVGIDLPESVYVDLMQLYRGKGLPIERIIIDLHSGRMFGTFGEYIMDIVALLFIFLALSGGWMWCRHMWRQS